MTTTPVLGLREVVQAAAGAYLAHNQALYVLEALTAKKALGIGTDTPPGSPTNGDTYTIGSSPTGAWAGKAAGTIAVASTSTDAGWLFVTPVTGLVLEDGTTRWRWDGSEWMPNYGHGLIYQEEGTTNQNLATNTWEVVGQFDTAGGNAVGVTEDHANERLTLGRKGAWIVKCMGALSGTNANPFLFRLVYDRAGTPAYSPVQTWVGIDGASGYRPLVIPEWRFPVTTTGLHVELQVKSVAEAMAIRNSSLILQADLLTRW